MKKLPVRVRKEAIDIIPEHHLWCLQKTFAENKKEYNPSTFIHIGINVGLKGLSDVEKVAVRKALEFIPVTERPAAGESLDSNLVRRFVAHNSEHLKQIWLNLVEVMSSKANVEVDFACNEDELIETMPHKLARKDSSVELAFSKSARMQRSSSSLSGSSTSPRITESRGSNLGPEQRLSSLSLGTLSPGTPTPYPRSTPVSPSPKPR
jgi:hypothetical protein